MPRFFVDKDRVFDGQVSIVGKDAHHVARSLRMAVGEEITVCDTDGREYLCQIASFDEDIEVIAKIISVSESENEPKIYIRLFQALPKGDKLDTIIQKAVECGASEIIPFQSERCVVKIKDAAEDRKTERRRRIAVEAAKQCRRSRLPDVCSAISFENAIELATESDLCLFCYEGEGTLPLGEILRSCSTLPRSVSIVVGSEGGFSEAEARLAAEKGATMTGLGKRILRTETASGFVLACLVMVSEL